MGTIDNHLLREVDLAQKFRYESAHKFGWISLLLSFGDANEFNIVAPGATFQVVYLASERGALFTETDDGVLRST